MSALPHDLTDHLHRQAIREVQAECLWSIGLMAYELGSDPTTLKRWLAADLPESPFQEKQEARLIANAAAFLASYNGPDLANHRRYHPTKRGTISLVREYGVLPSGRIHPHVKTCPHGHAYDESNTAYHPNGRRYCKTCKRNRARS